MNDKEESPPDPLVKLVSTHLESKGYEVRKILMMLGGGPIITAKRHDASHMIEVSFGLGVPSCCGPPNEPRDWNSTVLQLRIDQELQRIVFGQDREQGTVQDIDTFERLNRLLSELNEPPLEHDFLEAVLKARDTVLTSSPSTRRNIAHAKAIVYRGSNTTHEQEIRTLGKQLDAILIFIDSDMNVSSAGL